MAQRIVEMLIGRLIADERFRSNFLNDPEEALVGLRECGLDLTRTEIAALLNTDPDVWCRAADQLDPRLQKASFDSQSISQKERAHHG